ncbi:exonuclease domain-containing protein [Aneurinibacillus sp. Ricciae_BoGa-3]|uniref:exonuclease domain-containing protein n=1 Tax=Aneurinibacillus sp. Ricciae_BoGa-3 TaxID=3022697 RepID=UPI00234268CA|nr:exonuclease domain-containing protein [Aneurinibacillus sp. Ricciae_BoGa-3]WCK53924.1 exonuclease domain-containing protein [Aneurinibacillus sp. Ricciae_BoGa-3]
MMNPQPPDQGNWKQFISRMLSLGLQRNQIPVGSEGSSPNFHIEALIRSLMKEANKNQIKLSTPLQEIPFVILDTETTGFHPYHGDEIISLAAVKVIFGEMTTNVYQTLVKPSTSVPAHITELTGLSDISLQDAPRLRDVIHDILHFVSGGVIAGYHISHDITFLNAYLWYHHRTRITQRIIEIKNIVEKMWERTFTDLDETLDYFGIDKENRHTALGDAKMTGRLWLYVLEECRRKDINTLEDLYSKVANSQ